MLRKQPKILPFIERGNLIILESTVPPGTTDSVIRGKSKKMDML